MKDRPNRFAPRPLSTLPTCVIGPSRSTSATERRADQALFRQLGPLDHVHDLLLMEHVDAIAEKELVVLRRVPEEGATGTRRRADLVVELALGADIHTTGWIVEQDDFGLRREGACDQRLLAIAAAEREDRLTGART